ncbi:hypothetical protein [Specibacter sp. RAF43]|uniref:hypothetical protein n=1 Tax=Specibacter sp. RAF43 TaxID=3233057 RepID=UPI003F9AEE84
MDDRSHTSIDVSATVTIAASIEDAFDGFTEGIHLWWPVESQSIFGGESYVVFSDQLLLEESDAGDVRPWAEVDEWVRPESIAMRWVLDPDPRAQSSVRVSFSAGGAERSTVSVRQQRSSTNPGRGGFVWDWSLILSRYARYMGGSVGLD